MATACVPLGLYTWSSSKERLQQEAPRRQRSSLSMRPLAESGLVSSLNTPTRAHAVHPSLHAAKTVRLPWLERSRDTCVAAVTSEVCGTAERACKFPGASSNGPASKPAHPSPPEVQQHPVCCRPSAPPPIQERRGRDQNDCSVEYGGPQSVWPDGSRLAGPTDCVPAVDDGCVRVSAVQQILGNLLDAYAKRASHCETPPQATARSRSKGGPSRLPSHQHSKVTPPSNMMASGNRLDPSSKPRMVERVISHGKLRRVQTDSIKSVQSRTAQPEREPPHTQKRHSPPAVLPHSHTHSSRVSYDDDGGEVSRDVGSSSEGIHHVSPHDNEKETSRVSTANEQLKAHRRCQAHKQAEMQRQKQAAQLLEQAKSVARAEREENAQRRSASVAEWISRRQAIQETARRKACQAEEQATLDAVRVRLMRTEDQLSLQEWGGVDMVVQDLVRASHAFYQELQGLSNGRVIAHLPIVARWCASYWLEQRECEPTTLALYHGTRADVVEAIATEGLRLPDGVHVKHATTLSSRHGASSRIFASLSFDRALLHASGPDTVFMCLVLSGQDGPCDHAGTTYMFADEARLLPVFLPGGSSEAQRLTQHALTAIGRVLAQNGLSCQTQQASRPMSIHG